MSDQITLRFNGHLKAETCISTCPPGTKSGKNDPAPLPKMTVGGVLTPYFPGGGLKGTLRRRAVDLVRSALMDGTSSPFSLNDHYYLVLGGVKGDDKEDKADILGADTRRKANPIVGLFGAGDPWQQGRLYISHAVPPAEQADIQSVRGARVDDFARSGDNLHVLSEDDRQKWLHIAQVNNQRSGKDKELKKLETGLRDRGASEDSKKEMKVRAAALEAEIKALSNSSDYSNSINRPLDGYEVIPPGTDMAHSMTLSFGNMMEVGLLMGALRFWALDPWIGAHKSHGCGIVSGHWDVTIRRGYESAYEKFGDVTMTPFDGVVGRKELMEAEADFMAALRDGTDTFSFKYPARAA